MGNEDIQIAPVFDTIEEQPGQHFENAKIGFILGVLVCAVGSIFDGPAQAADQEGFEAQQFQVQVGAAFGICFWVVFAVFWIMVPWDIQKGNIQEGNHVLKVGVRQVSTSDDHIDVVEMSRTAQAVESFNNLVTHCKNFHWEVILP